MFRTFWILAGLLICSASFAFAGDAAVPSPGAQKIIQLSQAGIEDSVIVAFVQSQTTPLNLTPEDFGVLKAKGVSPAVMSAIVAHDGRLAAPVAASRPLTESSLYRLYSGVVYHDGLTYFSGAGLPNSMKQDLESDPYARPFIVSYEAQNGTSQTLLWSGFGLLVGGLLYSGISDAVNPSSAALNNTIGVSSLGVGVLSLLASNIFSAVSYKSLYDGLYQYNRDLINHASGGNP